MAWWASFLIAAVLGVGTSLAQTPAAAEPNRNVLNRPLPSWFSLGVHARARAEGRHGIAFVPNRDDGYLLSMLRLRLGVEPSRFFRVFVEGQDSRAAKNRPGSGNFTNHFDLRRAYAVVGDEEAGWWDVKVGRQELRFGSERLLGINDWANLPRSFDAAKLAIHHNGNRVDVFSASVVAIDPTEFDHHRDGQNVHGIYASLGSLVPGVVLEPHILYRTRPMVRDERGLQGDADTYTAGFRLASDTDQPWDFQTEMDWQFGTFGQDDLDAFMGLWGIGYRPPNLPWSPRFLVEYTYASGDSEPGDGKIETFDQLYARAHRIWGITDQVGGRNSKMLLTGAHFRPTPRTLLRIDHHFFWLANRRDGLYRNSGALIVPAPEGGASSGYVGHELDVQFSWNISSGLSFGTGVGHLFAGDFLKETTPGSSQTYPYIFLQFEL